MAMESETVNICSTWPDYEVKAMRDLMPSLSPSEQVTMAAMLLERAANVESGLAVRNSRLGEILRGLDKLLRYRWDRNNSMWAIDRANPFEHCWQFICWWPPDQIEELPAAFAEGDLQRFESPAEYLRYKRAKAAKIRDENERKATEQLLAVIADMPLKKLQQIRDVETAMITGEKIRAYGNDADILNRINDNNRRGLVVPDFEAKEE